MPSLYDLTETYERLMALLEAGEDFAYALEDIAGDIETKVDSMAGLVRYLETESGRLKAKAEAQENTARRLRLAIVQSMDALGLAHLRGTNNVHLQSTPHVEVVDPLALPPEYIVEIPATSRPDKAAALKFWRETGGLVPGTEIIQSKHIVIR